MSRLELGPRLRNWLDARLPYSPTVRFFREKVVPRHRHSFWYFFGGLTLFFLIIQILSGILLALNYSPSPERAYESVRDIVNAVPQGWLIRSIHSWSANFMVGSLFIHMFSTFFLKAYRKPRELMWLTGALLLFLVLGFGFTGYLLPWDTEAYFATLIGTEIPKSIPILGAWGVGILRGGEDIGAETLTRVYAIHVIILPLTTLIVVSFHILLNQLFGSSIPIGTQSRGKPIRFFPNFAFRDGIVWSIGFAGLIAVASLQPWGLGEKANALASAPLGIKPVWYFLPLYQTLRMLPSEILSLNGEIIANVLVMVGTLFWFLVPFLDRKASREQRERLFTVIGVVLAAYLLLTIILASTT